MPISDPGEQGFTPRWQPAEHGFTLIELMVVLVIIGLASAAVVVAMPDPRGRVVDEAERLAARAVATRDDAILQGRDASLLLTAAGYSVERRIHGRWQAAREKGFEPVAWKPGTQLALPPEQRLRATFDATGAVGDPITVVVARDGSQSIVVIPADGAVRVAR